MSLTVLYRVYTKLIGYALEVCRAQLFISLFQSLHGHPAILISKKWEFN